MTRIDGKSNIIDSVEIMLGEKEDVLAYSENAEKTLSIL